CNDTVLAMIHARCRHHDHYPLGLCETAFPRHQGIVIIEKGAEFIRTMGQCEKHVRDKTGFFLHRLDAGPNVLGKIRKLRYFETTGFLPVHGDLSKLECRKSIHMRTASS